MTGGFFAVRGSRPLSEEEFRSHLALAIRLENVAVLLGAGASASVGGHLMADIWNKFSESSPASVKWLNENGFLTGSVPENVETLLDRIEIAAEDLKRRKHEEFSKALAIHRHQLRKAVLRAAILKEALWDDVNSRAIVTP